ncbi:hypothetical protein Sjap_018788 [Stephania japonica]|uniref:Glycosyltransferase n=1 Tax=Stephania japonica TaxID=461633 RepID=A0AAP0I8P0_9MAGN
MSSASSKKPHAVCIPYPSQGHVTPMMQLAKILHSNGFYITFVNTEFNHNRILRSKGADSLKGVSDFRFESIPDGLPPSDRDATQHVPSLCDSVRKNCLKPLLQLLERLNSSTSDAPQVTCIVSDGVMSFAIQAGKILGIPEVQFWTTSACAFMDETYLTNGFIEMNLDWVPGMPNIKLKDLPSFATTTDPKDTMFDFMGEEAQNCLNSQAIIFNTFDELEHEVPSAITSKLAPSPRIYTLGPLPMLDQTDHTIESLKSIQPSLWREDLSCLEWLENKPPKSVIYVNYGSVTVMSDRNLIEFAWGLKNSSHPLLWIIRNDLVTGGGEDCSAGSTLPSEFIDETRDQGMITSWYQQEQVLKHPSIGGFLTHCGWTSMIESICGGVPIICWPFFADQQTNCRYACSTVWQIGVEMEREVMREDVDKCVKEVMENEKLRRRALEWKVRAQKATTNGGSSLRNLDRLIELLGVPKT